MSSHGMHSTELQVHYLGSSADLSALRRSMEARGVVSRVRLTPLVTAVVADPEVPFDHPTILAARELGIEVFSPAQAFDRLLSVTTRRDNRAAQLPVASTPLITIAVLVLVGVIALLGWLGALGDKAPPNTQNTTDVQQLVQTR